ncbi:MAG TPA: hypothetical protein V6C65_29485 [Allocoleopsis sp.]
MHALVQQAIESGYLTLAVEEQLRCLSQHQRDREDICALMRLQRAVMEGEVEQESRRARCEWIAKNVRSAAKSA